MLADEREINLRPWLYRIARNRCLNHLRKPTADAQESMDMVPAVEASSTAERVHNREEFRQLLADVKKLPETQRSALLLREMDALSYEEIAAAMETTVPSVKSLLVRARISLAEASQARLLTCGEVRIELSEAAEGLVKKVSAPVRRHVRECEECADFRSQVRSNEKAMAALFPVGGLFALKGFILSKLGLGGAGSASGSAGAGAAGAGAAGAGAVGSVGAAISGSSAAGGIGAIGGAIGTKAVAGVVTAAVLTAGAVEVKQQTSTTPVEPPAAKISGVQKHEPTAPAIAPAEVSQPKVVASAPAVTPAPEPAVEEVPAETAPAPAPVALDDEASAQATSGEETVGGTNPATEAVTVATPPAGAGTAAGVHSSGNPVVVVTVGGSTSTPAAAATTEPAPAAPPAEAAPVEEAASGDGEVPVAEEPVLP
jgi:hypothetical protein